MFIHYSCVCSKLVLIANGLTPRGRKVFFIFILMLHSHNYICGAGEAASRECEMKAYLFLPRVSL